MTPILTSARQTLQLEAQAILDQVERINGDFEKAVNLIAGSKGKLVVTGMGKSGIIGRKISATLASTGTTSFFLHPGEAYHGDLGMVSPGDVVLALSHSGETDEVLKIIPFFKDNGNPIIAISGNKNSTMARNADIHLYIYIEKEACPLKLAPTTSTTVMLALGDALALALMEVKSFKEENYARFHPGGALGRRLLSKVETVMRTYDLPVVEPNSSLTEIINTMSRGKLGMALVNEGDKTIGIITDGDLRRLMESKGKDAFDMKAESAMTRNPKKIKLKASLSEAEELFNLYKINSLVVADENDNTMGVIQIYNL